MIRPVSTDGQIDAGGAFKPIERPALMRRIQAAASRRIVLLVAPAGYGKSVAVRQYLQTMRDPYVLFAVQPGSGTLLGFVRGFADALREIAPDARKSLSGAYERARTSGAPGEELARWMHAHLKSFMGTIALDDLHLADGDPEIARFIAALIDCTKSRASWIVATRSAAGLPYATWLAYGDMDLNIDEEDLRFSIEEARTAAKAARVGARDEELHDILRMTQGWPTALSFALRSTTRSVDLRNIAATTREMIYRYLAEQVYSSLTKDERALLQLITCLPSLDLTVLRNAGYDNAESLVEALRGRVAFIHREGENEYRAHGLFLEFVAHQLSLEGEAARRSVLTRAAQALEKTGDLPAALNRYAQARCESKVLDLLREHGFALLDQAHDDDVQVAIDALAAQTRADDPHVIGLRAQRAYEAGQFERAEALFERGIAATSGSPLSWDLAIRLAITQINRGRDALAVLEPLSVLPLSAGARASVLGLTAVAYARAGRGEESRDAVNRAELLAESLEEDEIRAKLYLRIGVAAQSLAMPAQKVEALFTQAQSLAAERGLYAIAAHACSGLANTALFREDDATKTLWYAQQARAAAIKAGDRLAMQTALLQIVNIEARRGSTDRVLEFEALFARSATSDNARMSYIFPVRAMLAAWEGRFGEAYRLLSIADPGYFAFDRVFNTAVLALYAIADEKREQAIELAGRAYEQAQAERPPHLYGSRSLEIARALCACVETFAGRLTSSNRMLQQRPAADDPCANAFYEAALAIWRAAKRPALREESAEAIEHVCAIGWGGLSRILALVEARSFRARATESRDAVTPAELAILERLANGQSPKDIALETSRSIYTVQAHIANVIKKLQCNGRQEALSVARRRGLLQKSV